MNSIAKFVEMGVDEKGSIPMYNGTLSHLHLNSMQEKSGHGSSTEDLCRFFLDYRHQKEVAEEEEEEKEEEEKIGQDDLGTLHWTVEPVSNAP